MAPAAPPRAGESTGRIPRRFQASPNQRVCCDGCGGRIPAGRRTLSCLEHDYDVCEACAASPVATPLPPAAPRPAAAAGPVQGRVVARRPSESHRGVDAGMVLVETRLGNAAVEMMVSIQC